jgi:hypothetical protein
MVSQGLSGLRFSPEHTLRESPKFSFLLCSACLRCCVLAPALADYTAECLFYACAALAFAAFLFLGGTRACGSGDGNPEALTLPVPAPGCRQMLFQATRVSRTRHQTFDPFMHFCPPPFELSACIGLAFRVWWIQSEQAQYLWHDKAPSVK